MIFFKLKFNLLNKIFENNIKIYIHENKIMNSNEFRKKRENWRIFLL